MCVYALISHLHHLEQYLTLRNSHRIVVVTIIIKQLVNTYGRNNPWVGNKLNMSHSSIRFACNFNRFG